ncbi:MAG: SAF domain-containing protein [Actinomycetota bacterium]
MLWFQPFPWGRWALVLLIAGAAAYIEFMPDAKVEVPFAVRTINVGETIDETNTELRQIPDGLMETADLGAVAIQRITVGSPVVASAVGERGETVPPGWWVVGVRLPDGAAVGDEVKLVLLDTGDEVPGMVAHPGSDDPFAAADGGVAVPPESSADVALAAANGRLAVLVSTG